MAEEHAETRQERRARRLAAKRDRMQRHGAALAHVYANAIRKRAAGRSRPR